ncbi:MAG: sugar phosphate nucleotidyltransferase [Magnetospirillum sp.]|nr:sugar phosphate nucleotidyltransferase [Magnetospirillum sp.]
MVAIILAGGMGTRIAGIVPDRPKPLVTVAGRPFLHWVSRWVESQGETRMVLAARHLSEQVAAWAAAEIRERPGCRMIVCVEPSPLGTGGAVVNAASTWKDDRYLIVNGDSLALASLAAAYRWLDGDGTLDGVIVAVRAADAGRFGGLDIGDGGLLRGFHEKRPGAGLINAGIYLLRSRLLDRLAPGPLSLEQECIPFWLGQGARIGVVAADAPFIDIGTPESLAEADAFVETFLGLWDDPSRLPPTAPARQGGQ